MPDKQPQAPIADTIEHFHQCHGHRRADPYFWLRDDNRENPKVLDYLKAENDYTNATMAHLKGLEQQLYQEMTERLVPDDSSVPVFYKGYWRWSKFEKGQDYAINIRQKQTLTAEHEILLDQNERAKGHEYYKLAALACSPSQQYLAIAEDFVSRREYDIRVKDIETGEYLSEVISNTSGNLVWANDNKTIFYVRQHPTTLLPYQVYRHTLGTDPKDDILVYEEKDNTFYCSIGKTRSEKYIAIILKSTESSEALLLSAEQPTETPWVLHPRAKEHFYEMDHFDGHFYITSDLDAPNNQLFKVKDDAANFENWQLVLPHRKSTLIQDVALFDHFMVVNERVNGLEQLIIRDFDGNQTSQIEFNDGAYSTGLTANLDPSLQTIRYYYSSLTTPDSELEYDVTTGQSKLLKQDKVLGDFDSNNYHSERIMVAARDGVEVPVSIAYRKDKFNKDGTNPILNYAYGSYGITVDPHFAGSLVSLMDRGFVYAISHIRGSQMLGRDWYETGKKLTKLNTFNDFIDATKALVELGYGDRQRTYAQGGSAGGMLMGGIINMAPELYHGVIADVPFVDVVTTMLDESIPLTTGEYDEWGNPNDKTYYDYMLSYSPYDQVKAQDYPNLMVATGLHDSQVQYWEPAKWVAKLRATKTDNNLLLLETDMDAGHGGKSGRYRVYEELARQYAFLIDLAK